MAARGRSTIDSGWRQILLYGVLLAIGTAALDWLDYRWLARAYPTEIYVAVVAAAFLTLGVAIGARLLAARPGPIAAGNPRAIATLRISPRELDVLRAIAAGASNKEIARDLGIAPDTVKTHAARLFAKLEARRRTDAVARARDLGILP